MNVNAILRRLPHIVWLLLVWIALWGNFSVANVLSGLLMVSVFAWIFTDVGPRPASAVRPLYVVQLIGWFAQGLVMSSWQVARLTLSAKPIKPAIIAFTLRDVTDAVVTLIADAITLTPGTLTLDVRSDGEDSILYVHVLDLEDEASVREDLETLRRLALLAFGGRESMENLQETT